MRSHLISAKRLATMAALSCAAALTPAASLAATTSASTPSCTTAGLVVWMNTQGNGYAGGEDYTLNLTNLSGHTCTLHGYPGVSAVNLTGGQVGSPANWQTARPGTVDLANGATANAVLQIEEVYNFDPSLHCNPVTAAGLRVYPPNQTASKIIPFPFSACSRNGLVYMTAGPVT